MSKTERVIVDHRGSQALPALASFFIPGLGQLLQGRILAAIGWFCINAAAVASIAIAVGIVLAPLTWVMCIVDAAKFKG